MVIQSNSGIWGWFDYKKIYIELTEDLRRPYSFLYKWKQLGYKSNLSAFRITNLHLVDRHIDNNYLETHPHRWRTHINGGVGVRTSNTMFGLTISTFLLVGLQNKI